MASLMRPLNRCLTAMKQANNAGALSVIQQRYKSAGSPPTGTLDKPIDKKAVDKTADPKEACKYFIIVVIFGTK